ncbi:MAG: putative immunity protein [Dermatophilaceae bacterium]
MTYYKWLLPDGRTPIQRTPWPVAVGEWTPAETPVLCASGWHAMRERDVLTHLPSTLGSRLYRVSVRGEVVDGDNKVAAASMRLDDMLGVTTEENLRLFACDVARDVLPLFESHSPGDDRPRRTIEVAGRYATGHATAAELSAARAAAEATARAAALAAWAAAGAAAWTASRDAAEAAAGAAALAAARAAAEAAAGAAAWAALAAAGAAALAAARARYSNWLVVRIESGY